MRTPVCFLSLRHVLVGWLALTVSAATAMAGTTLVEPPLPAGRLIAVYDGIRCEFSPGQEELARLLAARVAARNAEAVAARAAAAAAPAAPPAVPAPLSPAEMRGNRENYLAAICAQLAMTKPTAWQEECYDAFLDNYEQTMRKFALIAEIVATNADRCEKLTVWSRAELVKRLEAGEKLAGFTYDPVTQKGMSTFYLPQVTLQDDKLKDMEEGRKKLKYDYQFRMGPAGDGTTDYHASVNSLSKKAPPADEVVTEEIQLQSLPVVIPPELEGRSAVEQADEFWENHFKGMFETIAQLGQYRPTLDVNIALLLLHETTEVGVYDRYYRGKDRRWFCDGVANYVPWRVIRDLHGLEVANGAYNLQAQLAKYADLAKQADLRKWPAAEHQQEGAQETRLSKARYAFAAQAVFLMNAHAGEDALPRLFTEIGKTKPNKVSFKTVEKSWQKVSSTKLDALLAEAVQPPRAAPAAVPSK